MEFLVVIFNEKSQGIMIATYSKINYIVDRTLIGINIAYN